MDCTDKKAFAAMMFPLGKIYDLGLEDKLIMQIWFTALSDYSVQEVASAVTRFIKNPDSAYKPKPADILRMIEGTSADQAMNAWSKVEAAIRRVGSYQTVVFDDPTIHRIIDDMGGWVDICQTSEDELPFRSKEFCNRYRGFVSRREIPQHNRRLYGLIDTKNGADGYGDTDPVLIGNHVLALEVMEGKKLPVPAEMFLLKN